MFEKRKSNLEKEGSTYIQETLNIEMSNIEDFYNEYFSKRDEIEIKINGNIKKVKINRNSKEYIKIIKEAFRNMVKHVEKEVSPLGEVLEKHGFIRKEQKMKRKSELEKECSKNIKEIFSSGKIREYDQFDRAILKNILVDTLETELKEILQKLKRYEEVIQVSYDDLRLIDYLRKVETDTNIDNIDNLLNDIYRINNKIKLQAIKDKKETR